MSLTSDVSEKREMVMQENEKKQSIGDALEFTYEVVKAIADAVMARGGGMQHLRRIVNEPALARQIADLIVPAGSEVERPLGENEYLVPVAYDMPRDRAKLESEFSKDGVSEMFYGNYEWQLHVSCIKIDQTPGERIMLVKHFRGSWSDSCGRNTTSEANIAEMDKLGYRPATHLEAYAFAKANPELQRQLQIVAPGSSVWSGGHRYVAVLRGDSRGRILTCDLSDREWDSGYRFLFVRQMIARLRRYLSVSPQKLIEVPKLIEQSQSGHPYRGAATNGNTLPPNHYRVHVTYAPLPSIKELGEGWDYRFASCFGDEDYSPPRIHASCVGMDRTPGERMFYVHDAGGNWESEERIAWGLVQRNAAAPNGYRPATHEETYEFAKAHPELVDFVGLGSFQIVGLGGNCNPVRHAFCIMQEGSRRSFVDEALDEGFGSETRVLFVSR
jgi:hypothetical protein